MLPLLAVLLTLQTDATSLSVDTERHGAIVSVIDKATGRDFSPPVVRPPLLYELRFTNSPSVSTFTEADADSSEIKSDNKSIIVITTRHTKLPITVQCRFRVEPNSPLIFGHISVDNRSDAELASVRFPAVAWRRQLSDKPDNDFLVVPRNDGCLVQSPGTTGWCPTMPYPGSASMQFIAAYDNTAGLYAAALDNKCHTKSIGVERTSDALRLALLHLPPRKSQTKWEADYEIALGTFRGDWQTAAVLYKQWAVKQPWCSHTVKDRVRSGDIPQWLVEPSLFYAYSLRGQTESKQIGNRVASLTSQAQQWQDLLGAPATMMLMSWEKLGPWVTPDYFPPFGGEKPFREAMTALHAKGHHSLVFLSGLKWTLRKQGGSDAGTLDDMAAFEQKGASSAICGPDGQPQHFGKANADVGENAQICPTTTLAREILLGSALKCQQLGIDCVQADQIVGGGMPPCFSTRHGHEHGYGNWSARALYKLFAEIRREARKNSKDFAWSIEEPGEFFIPVLDTYHARDYAQGRWPRDGAGVIGIPLFTHVYHEYLHGYGGDSCGVSTKPSATILYQQAMNLICGKAPGVAVWTTAYEPEHTDPAQARLLRSHLDLWAGEAREFLVFGERVATAPLNVPDVRRKFFVRSNSPARELDVPVILHSEWMLPKGVSAEFFVNAYTDIVNFEVGGRTVTLSPGEVNFYKKDCR